MSAASGESSSVPADGRRPDPPIYTARVENSGGTRGYVALEDGRSLSTGAPGNEGAGYNPEQFLAMSWSTCLGETLRVVLASRGLEHRSRVRVEVELRPEPGRGYFFAPTAHLAVEGVEPDAARELAEAAHARCPVSKLLSGRGEAAVHVEPWGRNAGAGD